MWEKRKMMNIKELNHRKTKCADNIRRKEYKIKKKVGCSIRMASKGNEKRLDRKLRDEIVWFA